MIKTKFYHNTDLNQRWYDCVVCGTSHRTVELQFTNGKSSLNYRAPIVGDVILGQTSGDGGTISKITIWSGTWAGENATGIMELTSPTGLSSQTADDNPFTAFSLGETVRNVTLSRSGVFITHATVYGQGKQYGRPHPEGDVIRYRGKIYCNRHFIYRFQQEWDDEEKIDIKEDNSEWI